MIQEKYGDYELDSYGPVKVSIPSFDVSDEEVETEMRRIASRHATNKDAEAHPINANDIVRIDIKTMEGNSIFPGLTHEGVDVQLGVGTLAEELETAMLGHMPGDTVEASYQYTDYSQVGNGMETPADGGCGVEDKGEPEKLELISTVKILALRKFVNPEVTDEWVAKNIALANTVEDFKNMTRKRLSKEHQRAFVKNIEYTVIEELGKRLVGEVPLEPVEKIEQQMLREFDRFLEQYELDRPSYLAIQGLTDVDFGEQIAKDAHDRIAQDIALASYATHEGIALDDGDIDFMFGEPTPERTFAARMEAEQSGQIDTFKDLALRAKIAEMLTRSAIYVDENGNEDKDFKKAVDDKYEKLQRVRDHATSEPMMAPPMVPIES